MEGPAIINIQEAKTHLSRHVEAVAAGAEIIIAKAGKPMARLVPYKPALPIRNLGRLAGTEGLAPESEDCWDPDESLEHAMSEAPLYETVPLQPTDRVAEED